MKRSNPSSTNGKGPAVLDLEVSPVQGLGIVQPAKPVIENSPLTEETLPVTVPEAGAEEVQPPTATPTSPNRPVKLLLAAAGVGAIAAGAMGYNWWQYASAHVETDNATVTGHIHQIGARVPGTVDQVLVQDNQVVQAGQPLVKLDPRDYQIKLQQAQADLAAAQQKANTAQISIALSAQTAVASNTQSQGDLARAQSAIATAQAQVAEAQAGVPKSQAQLAQSQANLQKAQSDFNRFTQLFSEGAIAQRDLETARQAYQVALAQKSADEQVIQQAQAKVAQAQQAVETAQAGLVSSQGGLQQSAAKGIQTEVSQSDFGTAKTAIAQAQVALRNAQLQLSYTTLTAPAKGRIGRKTVEVGQQVQAGTPLMALVSNEYWVTANFKETQLEKMHPGQRAEIELDAFPHKKFVGRVESLSPASGAQFALLPPDNATGNFTKIVQRVPVKVVFDPDSIHGYESVVAPGMSAMVTVDLK